MAIKISEGVFHLTTDKTSYVMDVYKGYLRHLYFGKLIDDADFAKVTKNFRIGSCVVMSESVFGDGATLDVIPQEVGTYGVGDYREPSVLITDGRGVSALDFKYDSFIVHSEKPQLVGMPSVRASETLEIRLKDSQSNITLKLFYTPVDGSGAIVRRVEIVNGSDSEIRIKKAMSFAVDLPNKNYKLIGFNGKYGREKELVVEDISWGVKKFQSTRGNYSSHQSNPSIILSELGANERYGSVVGVTLLYSGSFVMSAERGQSGDIRLTGGIGDLNFDWKLNPKQTFATPEAVMIYSDKGLGEMSRRFHDLFRENYIPENLVYKTRPIVANTWESCFMKFDNEKLKTFIRTAAKAGVDMVVLDDGWFKGRNNDKTSLGDWVVDENKLPNGLEEIIDCTKENDLQFGLWIEPEMISVDSDLFRAHPEWAITVPNREPKFGRNQLCLDYANREVIDYVKGVFDNILGRYDYTSYIKWDCNRAITEFYSSALDTDRQGELCHRYILGLYEVLSHVREKYPDVLIEGCAGGGGRFDAGMLYYTPQIWASDATDAEERTFIQYGTSVIYPLSTISAHVSDVPNVHTARKIHPEIRANIASVGVFGYETSFVGVDEDTLALYKKYADRYRRIADVVLTGDLYRLKSPFEGQYFATMVLNKEKTKGYIVTYRRSTSYARLQERLYLDGLDENKTYHVSGLDVTATGKTLKEFGICMEFSYTDFNGPYYEIQEVDA